jgi:hypothetical protein
VLSNILPFGHGEPVLTTRMFVDILRQIVQFVLTDPMLLWVLPELHISFGLFLTPYSGTVLYSSGRKGLLAWPY